MWVACSPTRQAMGGLSGGMVKVGVDMFKRGNQWTARPSQDQVITAQKVERATQFVAHALRFISFFCATTGRSVRRITLFLISVSMTFDHAHKIRVHFRTRAPTWRSQKRPDFGVPTIQHLTATLRMAGNGVDHAFRISNHVKHQLSVVSAR